MKNFTKQYWGAILLAVIALLYLIPYYFAIQREKDPVIEIYFADRITAAHQVLIDKYNALNAGKVRVVPTDFPNDDFSTNERKEILARSLRGEGDGIDLFAVDVIWVARFAKWCEPLGNYFTQEELSKISTISLQACYSDSQLVAIPFVRDQGVLFYREDILEKLPGGPGMIRQLDKGITWDEFTAFKRSLPGRQPYYIFPAAEYEGMICSFIENLLSVDPEYFNRHGFDFNTPEARRTLQLMVDLINKDRSTPSVVTSFTEVPSFKYFIENDGLFIRGWTTYDKDFETAPFDVNKQSKLKKAPLPYMTDGSPSSVLGGWDLMISKFSTKKNAVADFVKFLLREESQEIFYSQSGYYPVLNSFYEDSSYSRKYPDIRFIKSLLKSGVYRPSHQDYTKYSKIMSYYFTLALKNRISVNEALDKTTQSIRSDKSMTDTY
ncbi:MAG: extracellular solute-binding protein [Bacteroidetes bacterium]|nr:extracellular solute-binding protein [Bacteroidota bacterium]